MAGILLFLIAAALVAAAVWICFEFFDSDRVEEEKEENEMKVKEFAMKVTYKEGLKEQVSIAQVMEILKVADDLLEGDFYKLIRKRS